MKATNAKLKKNALNKEKARRHAKLYSWRSYVDKNAAEKHVHTHWVDFDGKKGGYMGETVTSEYKPETPAEKKLRKEKKKMPKK